MRSHVARSRRRSASIALVLALSLAGVAGRAAAEAGGAEEPFGFGKQEIGLSTGYGVAFGAFGSQGTDGEDVESIPVFPRWGIGITDPFGGDGWYRGSLSFTLEGIFLFNHEPRNGFAAGGAFSFRYNFLRGDRLVPYAEIGAGMTHLDFDLVDQRDGFNFILQLGAGAHWFLRERSALTVGWRMQHISNADTRKPNRSVNTNLFLIGPTFFLD